MILFVDNDVLEKLASWDLLEDGIAACGFAMADVRYLPSARFWLGLAGKKKCRYPAEVQERLRRLLRVAQPGAGDSAEQDALLPRVNDIDPGEALLLAQAARTEGSLLATGDKRCLRAAGSTNLAGSLAGRILCLEQILLLVIERLGFDEVKRRIVESNQLALDTAVRAAFGSGMEADDKNACGSLERRVRTLAAEAAGMLVPHDYRFCDDVTQT